VTLEERYAALDKLVRRLEDGLAVEATLADRSRDRQQEASERHEQWLQDQQAAIEAHNSAMTRPLLRMMSGWPRAMRNWTASPICSASAAETEASNRTT
jgi:hypothetical protein